MGSIGNTAHRPIREHTRLHQFVVDALLLGVESGIQHVVCPLFLRQDGDGIPVLADRFQDSAAPARLVQREVESEREFGVATHVVTFVSRSPTPNGLRRRRGQGHSRRSKITMTWITSIESGAPRSRRPRPVVRVDDGALVVGWVRPAGRPRSRG
ncbi:hypothetical protein ROP_37660 [Rhodococcus opacus B4]|uniref:Uncharacterized protein n=1 Tax=Rhodococcus opacus (strain B4) TaxID=632772 RepID=C1B8L0_RHOOB|nr:hypothetical protein ROP_37660 [Rhodococcus opacus B4]